MPGGVHENMKAWEPEEDRIIIELLGELGPRWSKIVKALPGRSISSIRNRWQRIDKGRKLRDEGHQSKNRCNICGEPKRGHVCFEKIRQAATQRQEENDEGLAEVLPDLSDMMPEEVEQSSEVAGQSGVAASACDDDDDDTLDVSELVAQVERRASEMDVSMSSPPPPPAVQMVDAATQVSDAEDEDEDEDPMESMVAPTLPIVRRLKSGSRICNELGFHDAAAASTDVQLAAPLEEIGIIPVSESRQDSSRSAHSESELLMPSRLPSLLSPLEQRRSFGDAIV